MKEKNKEQIDFMGNVAKDIILHKFKKTDTIKSAVDFFYKTMRKYGIKRGTKIKGQAGVQECNFEWTMCWIVFKDRLNSELDWDYDLFGNGVPKDLSYKIREEGYDEK